MIINIKINVKGVKTGSFTPEGATKPMDLYYMYDENNKRFKINKEIFDGIRNKKLPDDIGLAADTRLLTSDKDIIAID